MEPLDGKRNPGWFVTGTDTGVGKSVAAAWLVRGLGAAYWKPVQSGLDGEGDAEVVAQLGRPTMIHPSTYLLDAPLSPHEAARQQGITIDLAAFRLPTGPRPLVVEGAGGVLVPLNREALMVDLMQQLGLPVILVCRTTLGTINHTLLSLEALRRRGLAVTGVILNGPRDETNQEAITHYGRVTVLAHLPPIDPLTPASLAAIPAERPDLLPEWQS